MTSTVSVQRAVLRSDLPAPARHVMLTLAALADFKTGAIPTEHSPSLSEIADATDLGRSTVARILNVLEASGWVERDRPEVVDARTLGAKTIYRLKIGGSPTAGLGVVPERDQVDAKPSPTAGLDLVPQRDGPSPTAGRIRGTDLKVCTDPPPSTSLSQPAAQPAAQVAQTTRQGKKSRADRRGARLPAGFAVTDEMKTWAREHTPLAGLVDHEMFVDHWRAQSGQRAVKSDWVATWRNWMRRVQENKSRFQQQPSGARKSTTDERVATALDLGARLQASADAVQRKAITA